MAAASTDGAVASGGVVKAEDLLPSAFGDGARVDSSGKADDLSYDLGSLTAVDSHQVDAAKMQQKQENYLHKLTTGNVQLIVKRVFELPMEVTAQAPVAKLPMPSSKLPRAKPAPVPKPPTKWELFAAEKGLQKRKKSRHTFDDQLDQWVPRHGYKQGADDLKDWMVPVKKGENPYVDPWEKADLEKKQRVLNNKMSQMRNIERANKILGKNKPSVPAGIPLQLDMGEGTVNGLTGQGKQARAKPRGEDIASKKARLAKVQTSTASLGKFDKKVSGEPGRPQYSSRKSRRSLMDTASEKDRDVKTLKQILEGSMIVHVTSADGLSRTGPGTQYIMHRQVSVPCTGLAPTAPPETARSTATR